MKTSALFLTLLLFLLCFTACDGFLYVGDVWHNTPEEALAKEADTPINDKATLTVTTLLDRRETDDIVIMTFVSQNDTLVTVTFVTNEKRQYQVQGYTEEASLYEPTEFVLNGDKEQFILFPYHRAGSTIFGWCYETAAFTVNGQTPERQTHTFPCQGKDWSLDFWQIDGVSPDADVSIDYIDATTKSLHEYVQIEDVKIPTEYFAADMQETADVDLDLSTITKMLGSQDTDNYQYGALVESSDGTRTTYSSLICNHKTQSGAIRETEHYHSVEKDNAVITGETYQFHQLKNGVGYGLNETDGVFCGYTFSKGIYSDWSSYSPSNLELCHKATSLTYQTATKDDCTYMSISGTYNDYPNRLEYYTVSVEMIYIIKDRAVVAWLFKESATSPIKEGYWNTTKYCIPLNEDISLVDETLLASACQ